MAKVLGTTLFLLLVTLTSIGHANAQHNTSCANYVFKSKSRTYNTCVDLPVLNSVLHYNYHPTTQTLDIAYRHPDPSSASPKWVVWALNPTAKGMVGSQCLVAYRSPKDGSLVAYTSPNTSYETMLQKGDLSFNVTDLKAESGNDEIIIYASLKVPNNKTVLNQVWQEGPLSSDGTPRMHPLSGPNVRATASLDLLSGVVAPTSAGGARLGASWKTAHAVINAISWGIMMPLGVIMARYVKRFPSANPAWFYLHVGIQLSAYLLGIFGWATGLLLTSGSHHIHYHTHRCIGITVFCLATLQIPVALALRPKKDRKYRIYWNIYHYLVGYGTIVLAIVNIFEGFKIMNPKVYWKLGYVVVLLALLVVAFVFEACSWFAPKGEKKETNVEDNSKLPQDDTPCIRPEDCP